eukprot:5657409-Amphidinium_carterae.1
MLHVLPKIAGQSWSPTSCNMKSTAPISLETGLHKSKIASHMSASETSSSLSAVTLGVVVFDCY